MIKRTYLSNAVVTVFLAVTLTACGFHLRGNIPLPDGIKNMHVTGPGGSFTDQLESILENAGGVMALSEGSADVILNIEDASFKRTVGTLDERGKANSYNLIFSVRYELQDPQGKQIRKASLVESRLYNFDPELVMESESEEADLLTDMEQDIALRMVRQLSSITNYPAAPDQAGE